MTFKKKTYNNFEDLLQGEAEHFVEFPSDKVWNNIRTEVHGNKRWRALLVMFVLLFSAASITSLMFYPKQKSELAFQQEKQKSTQKIVAIESISNKKFNLFPTLNKDPKENILAKENKLEYNILSNENSSSENNSIVINEDNSFNQTENASTIFNDKSTKDIEPELTNNDIVEPTKNLVVENQIESNINENSTTNQIAILKEMSLKSVVSEVVNSKTNSKDVNNYLENIAPKVVSKKKSNSKWLYQIYATPSVSYRVMEDDKSRYNIPNASTDPNEINVNLNNIVKHKPSLGTEFGVSFLYPISKKVFVKTGLQFNSRKYQINATEEAGMANVSLVENNSLTNFQVAAKYKINNSNSTTEIDNTMYQLSVPIGLQLNVIEGEKWGIIAAASVQPTFFLNKSIYAVSTDYKYYVDGKQFFRKSNLNTSLELLLSLKAGQGKFVFGPQVRYQQYSTFKDAYPIKENRIDYGIKIGFMQNL